MDCKLVCVLSYWIDHLLVSRISWAFSFSLQLVLPHWYNITIIQANAYHGRMTHLANIFGYLAGYINLGEWSALNWIGGGQFRRLAVLSCAVMVICVTITCYTQEEKATEVKAGTGKGISWRKALRNVRESVRNLPLPVQRVCAGESCRLLISILWILMDL